MLATAKDVALFISYRFQNVWPVFGFYDLQRLLYLAQGWHLAGARGQLFSDSIAANRAAPVVLSIKGLLPINEMLPKANLTGETSQFLELFCKTYADAEPADARRQVENRESAWSLALAVGGENCVIPEALMEATFRLSLLNFAETSRHQRRSATLARARKATLYAPNVIQFPHH